MCIYVKHVATKKKTKSYINSIINLFLALLKIQYLVI